MSVTTQPSFHVFSFDGDHVLMDVRSSQVMFIDKLAFELLSLVERGMSISEAAVVLSEKEPAETVAQLLDELEMLRETLGLFTVEETTPGRVKRSWRGSLREHEPRSMMLLVSRACNLRCTYCYEVAHDWHRPGNQMEVADVERAVDEFLARSGRRKRLKITFFGGEALLNFGVIEAGVRHARRRAAQLGKSIVFSLTTNGTLLTDEVIEFLVEHEFIVMVSLDGSEEVHDLHRRDLAGNGTHAKVAKGVKALLARQLEAGVVPLKLRATLTVDSPDVEAVGRVLESYHGARVEIGASVEATASVSEADFSVQDAASTHRGQIEDARARQLLEFAENGDPWPKWGAFPRRLKELHDAIKQETLPMVASPNLCGLGRNMRAVTPDGDAYPCHRFVGLPAFRLRSGFDGHGELEKMDRIYSQLQSNFDEHCTKCWARFRCGGMCPWYLARESGGFDTPGGQRCEGIRRSWERAMWLYLRLARDAPARLEELVGPLRDAAVA